MSIYTQGLRKRPTYEELIDEIQTDTKVTLPNRKAKFLRDSPYMSFLDEESYQEMEDQTMARNKHLQAEQVIQQQASQGGDTASVLRATQAPPQAPPQAPNLSSAGAASQGSYSTAGGYVMDLVNRIQQGEDKNTQNKSKAMTQMFDIGSPRVGGVSMEIEDPFQTTSNPAQKRSIVDDPNSEVQAKPKSKSKAMPKAMSKPSPKTKPAPDPSASSSSAAAAAPSTKAKAKAAPKLQDFPTNITEVNQLSKPELLTLLTTDTGMAVKEIRDLDKQELRDTLIDMLGLDPKPKTSKSAEVQQKEKMKKKSATVDVSRGSASRDLDLDKRKSYWNKQSITYIKAELEKRGFTFPDAAKKGKNKLKKNDLLQMLFRNDRIN